MKSGPGRLQDIELFAESAALVAGTPERMLMRQVDVAREVFALSVDDHRALLEGVEMFWGIQAASRLVFELRHNLVSRVPF